MLPKITVLSLGWISEGEVRVVLRLSDRLTVPMPQEGPEHAIALLTMVVGEDGRLLPAIKDAGYAGLVIEAFGGGHVPSRIAGGSKSWRARCQWSWPPAPEAGRF